MAPSPEDERTPLINPTTATAATTTTTSKGFWRLLSAAVVVSVVFVGVATLGYGPRFLTDRLGHHDIPNKYILISLGRSGSTPTFAAIDKLTHGQMRPLDKTMLYEILGSSSHAMQKHADPDRKTRRFFEKKLVQNPTTPTAGFKWKPLVDNDNYDRVWKWCAENGVKLILMTRNPLDMVISEQKHHENPSLNPHCHGPDCVAKHAAVRVTLPVGDELFDRMTKLQAHYDLTRGKCAAMHAKCFETSYEKLFAKDDKKQLAAWHELIAFVQDESHASMQVTKEYVKFAIGISEDTSPGDRSQYVANWRAVESSVKSSKWAETLECSTDDPGTAKEGCSMPTEGLR